MPRRFEPKLNYYVPSTFYTSSLVLNVLIIRCCQSRSGTDTFTMNAVQPITHMDCKQGDMKPMTTQEENQIPSDRGDVDRSAKGEVRHTTIVPAFLIL